MAFRMGGGGNRRNDNRFDNRGFNGGMNRPRPWGGDEMGGGNFRQGNPGGNMNNDVLSLANSLVNNLLRNQNHPPSLLDLPNRGGYGNRDNYGRFDDRMNRGNRNVGNNRRNGPPSGVRKIDKLGAIKGGIRKRTTVNTAKKVLAKNAGKELDETSADKTNLSVRKDKRESRYSDVPNVMFYCHMCKKHMWDASSFENHVKGRTHLMMRDGVEESYRLRANMIRQEAKIEEQLKTIELDRLKRMGKGGKGSRREYCTMCDLHFFGHLSAHRKTDGHLQLKKFLHPRCTDCAQEFPNRIDFDNHMLTPDHMKKAFVTKSNKPERRKNALVISTEEEELKDLKEEKEEKKPVAVKKEGEEEAMETDEAAATGDAEENGKAEDAEVKEGEAAEGAEAKPEEKAAEPVPEPDDVILDYIEGDEVPVEIDNKIPKYNCNRQIGASLLHKLDCFECHLCGRFFDTERTAEIHSRTVTHHRNFVKFLNEKSGDTKIAQRRAAAALEEIERKKKKLEAAATAAEEAATNGDEKKEGEDTYDPSEATGEEDKAKDADETMESQDGDETFEDANATVKEEPIVEEVPEPEPEPIPEPVKIETPSPKATPKATRGGRARGGRRN